MDEREIAAERPAEILAVVFTFQFFAILVIVVGGFVIARQADALPIGSPAFNVIVAASLASSIWLYWVGSGLLFGRWIAWGAALLTCLIASVASVFYSSFLDTGLALITTTTPSARVILTLLVNAPVVVVVGVLCRRRSRNWFRFAEELCGAFQASGEILALAAPIAGESQTTSGSGGLKMQKKHDYEPLLNELRAQASESLSRDSTSIESTSITAGKVDAADRHTEIATKARETAVMGLSVEVIAGPHRGIRMNFHDRATLLIGRGDDVGLQLVNDPYFSRHHFQLEFDPPRCRLVDLGSTNGTQVNGVRVMDCFLHRATPSPAVRP